MKDNGSIGAVSDGSSTLLARARNYLDNGWRIVPVPHRKKAPIISNWPALKLTLDDVM